jgi:hypothetical protein
MLLIDDSRAVPAAAPVLAMATRASRDELAFAEIAVVRRGLSKKACSERARKDERKNANHASADSLHDPEN